MEMFNSYGRMIVNCHTSGLFVFKISFNLIGLEVGTNLMRILRNDFFRGRLKLSYIFQEKGWPQGLPELLDSDRINETVYQ